MSNSFDPLRGEDQTHPHQKRIYVPRANLQKAWPETAHQPSKQGVLACVRKVGTIISKHVSAAMPVLIKKLNQTLRGWANYHRHVVAAQAFSRIDTYGFEQLWRMVKRRHQNKSQALAVQEVLDSIRPETYFCR